MLFIVFFIIFTSQILSTQCKCGIWREFNHNKELSDPNPVWYKLDRYWFADSGIKSYGFESLDKQPMCDDMEMFHQCNRAQFLLDKYSELGNLPYTNLGCSQHISCAATLHSDGTFWCQNMDSFELCLVAQTILNNTNFQVSCKQAEVLTDGFPILNYRKLRPTTTTVTTTTESNETSVTAHPTQPSIGMSVVPNFILLLAIILNIM